MIAHSAPTIGDQERAAVDRVLRSGHIAQGPETEAFEAEAAAFVGRRHAVALNSGTSALHLALIALGMTDDAPVAVPSYACASLITAVRLSGAVPVLCDAGPDFNALEPEPSNAGTSIAVHLFGLRAPLAAQPGIEDIAQSIGGGSGQQGRTVVTSFYATKLMTTGEGGMVFTDDETLAEAIRDMRDYDNRPDFRSRFNYKMTDLQAAMGRVQLRRLPEFIARRRAIAARYDAAFQPLPLQRPPRDGHVYFRYVIASDERDAIERHVRNRGVDAKRPVFQPAHHYLGGSFPGADRAHAEALSLPIYPGLNDDQIQHVIDSVVTYFD